MQPIPKWALWLGGALAWVAGVTFALFALSAPARSEMAFAPERARLVCAGAQPETMKAHGNAMLVPAPSAAHPRDCRVEIDFSARDAALAERAAAAGYVELVGLKLARAAFPQRLAANGEGITLTKRPDGGLMLALALETLFAGDRGRGAALILAWRSGEGDDARTHLSSTLLLERAGSSGLHRTKSPGN